MEPVETNTGIGESEREMVFVTCYPRNSVKLVVPVETDTGIKKDSEK